MLQIRSRTEAKMSFSDKLRSDHRSKRDIEKERQINRYASIVNQKDRIVAEFRQKCLFATQNGERSISYIVDVCPRPGEYGGIEYSCTIEKSDISAARALCMDVKAELIKEHFKKLSVDLVHLRFHDSYLYVLFLFPVSIKKKDKAGRHNMVIEASW